MTNSPEAAEPTFAALDPSGREITTRSFVAPPVDLTQARVAFLWDLLFHGDVVFDVLATELRRGYPEIQFVGHEVFGNFHGAEDREVMTALPERLREHRIDAVIAGVGA